MQVILLEPVDTAGIRADKRFHAQLNRDMDIDARNATERDDYLLLPRGTDVYLKITGANFDQPGLLGGAKLTIDYVVFNGKQIPLKIGAQSLDLPGPVYERRQPPTQVVVPAGKIYNWFTFEQVDVSTEGLNLPPARKLVLPPDPKAPFDDGRRSIADFNPSWFLHNLIAVGTISRVERTGSVLTLYFRESPDGTFIVCVPPELFKAGSGIGFPCPSPFKCNVIQPYITSRIVFP